MLYIKNTFSKKIFFLSSFFEHFFRNQNNLVIAKKKFKIKYFFYHPFKNFYNSKNTQDGK
jgi:hypothetical protein